MKYSNYLAIAVFICLNLLVSTNSIAQKGTSKISKKEPVHSSRSLYEKYIDDNEDLHLKEFMELVSIPGISSIPASKPEVEKAAAWIVNKLKSIGITTAQT